MKSSHILLIDDHKINRVFVKYVFSRITDQVHFSEASDGEEALRLFYNAKQKVDLIILDIQMPEMDGIEFLEALSVHQLSDLPPIFMLTSSTSLKNKLKCLSYKFVKKVYDKPFTLENATELHQMME